MLFALFTVIPLKVSILVILCMQLKQILATIFPNCVLRYRNMNTFGTTEPKGDANPILACAISLVRDKEQAILYFMPKRNAWSVIRTKGNPTSSALVNALSRSMSRKKNRKQQGGWICLQTSYPMLGKEFLVMHDLLNQNDLSACHRRQQ